MLLQDGKRNKALEQTGAPVKPTVMLLNPASLTLAGDPGVIHQTFAGN